MMTNFDRSLGLGASDSAPAIGLSKWKTPYQLFREKVLGEEPDIKELLHIEIGQALEPLILTRFTRRTELAVSRQQERIYHPDHAWMWATVDGVASDGGLIEAKSVGFASPDEWGDEDTDEIPMQYYTQTQHGMACGGFEFAYVPVVMLNRQERLYTIKRDDAFIAKMIEREQEFVDMLVSKTAPELTTLADVKLAFPRDNGMSKYIDPEHYGVLTHFKTVKEELKKLEEDKKSLQTSLAAYLGDNTNLVDPASGEVLLTYKSQTRTGIDSTSLKKEQPNIFKAYSKTSEFRVMRTRGE